MPGPVKRCAAVTVLVISALTTPFSSSPASAGDVLLPAEVVSVSLWVTRGQAWAVATIRNTGSEWMYPMAGVEFEHDCDGLLSISLVSLPVPLAPGALATGVGHGGRNCAPGTPTLVGASASGLVNPPSSGTIGISQPTRFVVNTDTQTIAAHDGRIHNPQPFAVDISTLGVTFYDSAGTVVSAGWVSLDAIIGPGGELPVIASGPLRPGIVRAKLSVQARQAAKPDLPITSFDNYYLDSFTNKFLDDIAWLASEGITAGCGAFRFCPDGLVTRGQMATFLVRALELPATGTDYFTDDEGSVHENNINRLRAAGITAGCGGSRFCPDGLVTRAQMATFLVRGFDLPATASDYFTDDEGSVHEPNINALSASNITHGCGGTRFCPNGIVTRGQMAAFLHRALD
jgi:hypothetical protein